LYKLKFKKEETPSKKIIQNLKGKRRKILKAVYKSLCERKKKLCYRFGRFVGKLMIYFKN